MEIPDFIVTAADARKIFLGPVEFSFYGLNVPQRFTALVEAAPVSDIVPLTGLLRFDTCAGRRQRLLQLAVSCARRMAADATDYDEIRVGIAYSNRLFSGEVIDTAEVRRICLDLIRPPFRPHVVNMRATCIANALSALSKPVTPVDCTYDYATAALGAASLAGGDAECEAQRADLLEIYKGRSDLTSKLRLPKSTKAPHEA